MTTQTEKKEKSLAEFVMIIVLVGIMMTVFIKYFIQSEAQFTQAGFSAIAQTFNTKVNAVHAQWMMDKQPKVVHLASLNQKTKQAVPVNNAGWIDVQKGERSCEAIWLLAIDSPINEVKFSVVAIEVHTANGMHNKKKGVVTNRECRYVLDDGSYFQYNRTKGKVSKVLTLR